MAEERLQEIRAKRLDKRAVLLAQQVAPYPSEVRRTHTLKQLTEQFEVLQKEGTPVVVAGRVTSLRRHGGVVFADLRDAEGEFQVQLSRDTLGEDLFNRLEYVDSGDWLQMAGKIILTQRGVKTLAAAEFSFLSKSIRPLPEEWFGLKDHETRYRQRELDLVLNPEVRRTFATRARAVQWLRTYMTENGYMEVETPVLQPIAGGAAARPFSTHHNAQDMTLYLRIAAELYLKRLLVGGYEKVFEIGSRFRNEGMDRQHNPEFSMLESQWAYADYEDLMDFTEDILEKLVTTLLSSTSVTWQGETLSFARPFKRERYVNLVSKRLGVDILTEKNPAAYIEIFKKEKLALPQIQTYAKLVDELYKELIRPNLVQPTLLYDYPAEMVPLAKRNLTDPRVAEKFQLLVHGLELVNAYTELNDPVLQRDIFLEQAEAEKAGDLEAQRIDETYLRAMEYGMPPNAGWGLGVDRLVMLLTDSPSLRDTILFPLLRPEA